MADRILKSDGDVQIDKVSFTFQDPYSLCSITRPVRGSKCAHAQCFDLLTYLMFQDSSKIRNWQCPICSKDCRKLIIDKLQMKMMQEFEDQQNLPRMITWHRDGRIDFGVNEIESDSEGEEDYSSLKKVKQICK